MTALAFLALGLSVGVVLGARLRKVQRDRLHRRVAELTEDIKQADDLNVRLARSIVELSPVPYLPTKRLMDAVRAEQERVR